MLNWDNLCWYGGGWDMEKCGECLFTSTDYSDCININNRIDTITENCNDLNKCDEDCKKRIWI